MACSTNSRRTSARTSLVRSDYRALRDFDTSLDPSPPTPLPEGEGSVERNRTVGRFRNCQWRSSMDEKLKRRIIMFYIGGILNALLGLYVLIEGASFLPPDTARILVLVFLAFAAVDFYFPYMLKRKWLAENAGKQAQDSDRVQRS